MATRSIGEILEEILVELKKSNADNERIKARLEKLESQDQLLNATQAARILGISTRTLYNWERQGRIKKVTKSGLIGYSANELNSIR